MEFSMSKLLVICAIIGVAWITQDYWQPKVDQSVENVLNPQATQEEPAKPVTLQEYDS